MTQLTGLNAPLKNALRRSNSCVNNAWAPLMLSKDFKEFVELLKRHEVEYMIVDGYAVGVHGYPRFW